MNLSLTFPLWKTLSICTAVSMLLPLPLIGTLGDYVQRSVDHGFLGVRE